MTEGRSNYDTMREAAESRFLLYDQQGMIQKFSLVHDERYLYLIFVGRMYRVDRSKGSVEWSTDDFSTAVNAGFEETLTILDVLCESKKDCCLCGRFNLIDRMKGTHYAAAPGSGLYREAAEYFDRNLACLKKALENLGGTPERPGDAACRLKIFDFLPVIFQFWASDEEFPATLKFMWDENTLDFIHFETAFYVMGHVLNRIKEEMEKLSSQEKMPM